MSTFRETLVATLESVTDLPTLPEIVLTIERALADDDISADDVARIIAEDPSLATNVLRVVNSVYFSGSVGPVTSVSNAVARLGFAEVRRLCTAVTLVRTMQGTGQGLDHEQFWKHSLVAGVTTSIIRKYSAVQDAFSADDAYTAGLLHDIGILILDQYFPNVFRQVKIISAQSEKPYSETELFLLKLDHGEIGGYILEKWGLPQSIVEAVSWHHQPGRATPDNAPLVQAVHLAESVCTTLGIGDGGDGIAPAFSESAWHDLKLSADDIPDIIEAVQAESNKYGSFFAGVLTDD